MQTGSLAKYLALASFAAAPLAAHASDNDVMQQCVKAFTTENFPGRSTHVNAEKQVTLPGPLALHRTPRVKLEAKGVESGRLLASATCTQKNGTVTVSPASTTAVVAAAR
jgi:hypothetical protein